VNEGTIDGLSSLYAHFADIPVSKKDTVRVFNMHLYSNKLDKNDHTFYNDLISGKESTDYKKDVSKILGIFDKIRSSAKIRNEQISFLLKGISQTHYPVILSGDMNETPISYSYNQLKKDLKDVFLEFGTGIGSTYNGIFPAYRIDYIFYKKLTPIYFNTLEVKYSDHFPIAATFTLR
jgi:hypothetical protein